MTVDLRDSEREPTWAEVRSALSWIESEGDIHDQHVPMITAAVYVARWRNARAGANGRPPSDPSAGEGPPLRVLEEAIADGRSEVTRDNAEIAALRDRVRVLTEALRLAGQYLKDVCGQDWRHDDAINNAVATIERATTQEPHTKEPTP